MERSAKALVAILAALMLAGCGLFKERVVVKIVEAPKPEVDVRILELCDVTLTPLETSKAVPPEALFSSYGQTIDKFNACACRQREARNALCKITAPGCTAIPVCAAPTPTPTDVPPPTK